MPRRPPEKFDAHLIDREVARVDFATLGPRREITDPATIGARIESAKKTWSRFIHAKRSGNTGKVKPFMIQFEPLMETLNLVDIPQDIALKAMDSIILQVPGMMKEGTTYRLIDPEALKGHMAEGKKRAEAEKGGRATQRIEKFAEANRVRMQGQQQAENFIRQTLEAMRQAAAKGGAALKRLIESLREAPRKTGELAEISDTAYRKAVLEVLPFHESKKSVTILEISFASGLFEHDVRTAMKKLIEEGLAAHVGDKLNRYSTSGYAKAYRKTPKADEK